MPWRRKDPDLGLATAQIDAGNYSAAVASLKRVLGRDPENARAFALLALCRLDQERIADAGQAIASALTLNAEVPAYHWIDGRIALARTDWENAEQAFRRAIDLDADDPDGYLGMAMLWMARMKPARARDWLAQALEIDSENLDGLFLLAQIELDRGALDTAQGLAERALAINAQHAGACLVLGEVLARRGDTMTAAELASVVLSQEPDNESALELLALIQARRNPLFGLWWKGEQSLKRLGPGVRVVFVLALGFVYAVSDEALARQQMMDWKYGLAAVFFPLLIYACFGHMALTLMIERAKRKIRLNADF